MYAPHDPAPGDASDSNESGVPKRKPKPKPAAKKKQPCKRRSVAEGGGTKGQFERHRALREHLIQQYYASLRNPQLRFPGPEELGIEHEVTEKTIREDIKFLRDRELLPVTNIRARGGYGLTEEVKALPGDEFTRGEYLALWLSVQSFEAWGGLPHQKRMPAIMRKLKATAPAMDPAQLARMRQTITFKAGGFEAPVSQETFEIVLHALLGREELTFHYSSLTVMRSALAATPGAKPASHHRLAKAIAAVKEGQPFGASILLAPAITGSTAADANTTPELRRVQPLHLVCWEHAWYLFAYDYAREGIRTFALGRMGNVAATGVHFTPAVKFNLARELEHSFGITRGGKPVDVHLQFEPDAIPLIIERLWHPSQLLIENEDGTLDLRMRVAIHPELIRWIKSWGSNVQVLAPRSLEDQLLADANRLLDRARLRRAAIPS
jgi:predicted DNA-binding transcriptional regulator YafY